MASMTCGYSCVKYLLFIFNLIIWIVGAVLLAIGIWFLVDQNAFKLLHVAGFSTADTLIKGAAIALIVVGGLIFIIAGFGCYGACSESACCLYTFATLMSIILAGQVIAAILCGVFRNQVSSNLDTTMTQDIQLYYNKTGNESLTESWDYMQSQLQCCGVNGPSDWQNSYFHQTYPLLFVPYSCCTSSNALAQCEADAAVNNTKSQNVYTTGCQKALETWIVGHLAILIGIAIGLIAIQVIGIIMACCLAREVQNKGVFA